MKFFFFFFFFFPPFLIASYEKLTDSKNVYYSSTHFRAIAGVYYQDSTLIKNLCNKLLDYAEESWEVEVNQLGFKAPKNTDTKKIDIYVGNYSAYNYETESYASITSFYAGYATLYPTDDTAYFVMNPDMSNNLLRITIAHEFFHTIHYSYFYINLISNNNIWWLEATAVLMEDEVYDDIDDYIYFMNPFFNASNLDFEIYNGSHEYSMVIFSKFIKEKYGMEFIKDTFLRFSNVTPEYGFFEIIDEILKEQYNTDIQEALREFYSWVENPSQYYEEGDKYPTLRTFSKDDTIDIAKGGFAKVEGIQSGWNMISLPNSDLSYLDSDQTIFGYSDGKWSVNKELLDLEYLSSSNSSSGYWLQSSQSDSMIYGYFDKSDYDDLDNLKNGWNLVSFSESKSLTQFDNFKVWYYKDNQWYGYFGGEDKSSFGVLPLESIDNFKAYWVYK